MSISFFTELIDIPREELQHADIKEIGMELDWFSHVYGTTILAGTLKYESYKNYRRKDEFNKNVLETPLDIKTMIFIHDWQVCSNTIDKFGTIANLFRNQPCDEYTNHMVFSIKPPKLKKNGKPEKHFNVQRKKRFRVPVINGLMTDGRIVKSTIISCTFRNLK